MLKTYVDPAEHLPKLRIKTKQQLNLRISLQIPDEHPVKRQDEIVGSGSCGLRRDAAKKHIGQSDGGDHLSN
jgi:hypothetical protein